MIKIFEEKDVFVLKTLHKDIWWEMDSWREFNLLVGSRYQNLESAERAKSYIESEYYKNNHPY